MGGEPLGGSLCRDCEGPIGDPGDHETWRILGCLLGGGLGDPEDPRDPRDSGNPPPPLLVSRFIGLPIWAAPGTPESARSPLPPNSCTFLT